MDPIGRSELYAQLVRREIDSGGLRIPFWRRAVEECLGDFGRAVECYVRLRVGQMTEAEAEHRAAERRLRRLRRFYDSLPRAYGPPSDPP